MVAQIDNNFIKLSIKKTYTRLLSYALYEGRPLTTRGRCINPVLSFLFRVQQYFPFPKVVKAPVFIIGTGRSGTTILGITLAMHDRVGFLNEPKAIWNYLFPDEDLIGSYSVKSGRYRLGAEDAGQELITRAHKLLGSYLFFSSSSRLIDKYPELVFRFDFVRAIYPDAKFLFLYRNGVDTYSSIERWSFDNSVDSNGYIDDWWGRDDRKWHLLCDQIVSTDPTLGPCAEDIKRYRDQRDRAAVEWIVSMKEGTRLSEAYPDVVLPVKYEDYVRSAEYRAKILKFCDLPVDKNYSEYCLDVLKTPTPKSNKQLPDEINEEFCSVMKMLGYD